jgi:hypothetical protein
MISRVRVEARAASMDDASREIDVLLGHLRMAGVLEGIVPQVSSVTDEHFGAVLGKEDAWHMLGLRNEGRVVVSFEPERADGGLKQFGFEVREKIDIPTMAPIASSTGLHFTMSASAPMVPEWRDVDDAIVLLRQFPVWRDNSWDRVVRAGEAQEDAEAILSDIRTIKDVIDVGAALGVDGATVVVRMDRRTDVVVERPTLREAALDARDVVVESLKASSDD